MVAPPAKALSSSINDTSTTINGLPNFGPYLNSLDPAVDAYHSLPSPPSAVLTDAEQAIVKIVGDISSVAL